MNTQNLFFSCLAKEINPQYRFECEQISNTKTLYELYELSHEHDMSHIVAKYLKENKITVNPILERLFLKDMMLAIHRHEKREYELKVIVAALEAINIPYILLKGAVLKDMYPNAWTRTSCDIDILIRREDLEKAIDYLSTHLKYELRSRDTHDVHLYAQSGVHLELHFNLIECLPKTDLVLDKVWENTFAENMNHKMNNEMLYFYHIAHMLKHFVHGGCGIKSFLDLWVLNHNLEFDFEKRAELLQQGGIYDFACVAEKVAEIWFGKEEHNEITRTIEKFVLEGGVYGTLSNRVLIQRTKCDNKWQFIMMRIFMPYRDMKIEFPILNRWRILLPFFWVIRWFRIAFRGRLTRFKQEMKLNEDINEENKVCMEQLIHTLGLDIPMTK